MQDYLPAVAALAMVLFGALTLWLLLDGLTRAARGRSRVGVGGLIAMTLSSLLTAALAIWELVDALHEVH
jgi:hypothetical protein